MKTAIEVLERIKRGVEYEDIEEIRSRYTTWTRSVDTTYKIPKGEREYMADKILDMMKKCRMNFTEACIVAGYVRRLLRIDGNYIGGLDIEKVYIEKCLTADLIDLSKRIAEYLETQCEVYVDVSMVITDVYNILVTRSKENLLW